MAEEEVGLRVSLKDRAQTARGLREIDDDLTRTGKSAELAGSRARIGSRGFKILGQAAKIGLIGAAAGLVAVTAASAGFVKAAADDQKGARRLAVTLRNTTGARRRDVRSIEGWISAQGKALGIVDDDLRPAVSTLAIATGDLGKARSLTTLAMDVAAGKEKDLGTVATALAKAYTGNVAGLGRLGIATKDAEGNTLSFEQVTKNLATTFEGQAAAGADTAAGKYDRFRLALSETGEAIGYQLLPYASRLGDWLVAKGIPLVEKWGGKIESDVIPAVKRFVDNARPLANEVLPAVGTAMGTVRDALSAAAPYARDMVAAFNDMPDWAKKALVGGALVGVAAKKTGALSAGTSAAGALGSMVSKAKPLPVFVTNPGALGLGGGKGKTPAVVPGGKPGAATPGVPAKPSLLGSSLGLKGFLGTAAKVATAPITGATLASAGSTNVGTKPVAVQTDPTTIARMQQIAETIKQQTAAAQAAADYAGRKGFADMLLGPLDLAKGKSKDVEAALRGVANTKVNPKIEPIGFPQAQTKSDRLRGSLEGLTRTTYVARADLDTNAAYAKLSALRAAAKMAASPGSAVPGGPEMRALGGPVKAGRPYIVGERRPEYFVPHTNGRIMPRVPTRPAMPTPDTDSPDARAGGPGGDGATYVFQSILDGRIVAETVIDNLNDQLARR